MLFPFRQRIALAAAVALLALPLGSATLPNRPATEAALPAVAAAQPLVHAAPANPQPALARYIAATYRKPLAYAGDIVRTTFEVAQKYALPPGLLLAMMAKESSFDTSARSSYGALGLMQVVPRFHRDRLRSHETARSLHEPRTNIRVAAHILAEYLVAHGDLDKALKKYSGSAKGYSRAVRSKWHLFERVGQRADTPRDRSPA
jgi:soluble lytic murein transglycosylase-like protein